MVGDDHGTLAEQRREQQRKLSRDGIVPLRIARTDVAVSHGGTRRQPRREGRQRRLEITHDQMRGIGHAFGMRVGTPLEDEDFPVTQTVAQMVEGPTIAEPELQHRPRQVRDQIDSMIQAGTLSLEAANEAVESAQPSVLPAVPSNLVNIVLPSPA